MHNDTMARTGSLCVAQMYNSYRQDTLKSIHTKKTKNKKDRKKTPEFSILHFKRFLQRKKEHFLLTENHITFKQFLIFCRKKMEKFPKILAAAPQHGNGP